MLRSDTHAPCFRSALYVVLRIDSANAEKRERQGARTRRSLLARGA
jgi:hypothetical protein